MGFTLILEFMVDTPIENGRMLGEGEVRGAGTCQEGGAQNVACEINCFW